MMKYVKLVSINIFVLIVLLAAIEGFFRLFAKGSSSVDGQWLTFRPYTMFSTPYNPSKGWQWDDQFHGRKINAQLTNNEYGFPMKEPVSLTKVRPKASNERVVLLSGGSSLWGVGGSSDANSISGQLELKLNAAQSKFHYTVLNLAMGGWASFQEFIALSMYGPNLQPDWIVTMDGENDAAVACAHSQGAGYPLYYGLMEAYFNGYLSAQLQPTFYRGWFENELIRHSHAYRALTGRQYINVNVKFDTSQGDVTKYVVRDANWSDLEQQLVFYINIQQRLIDLFPDKNILLSTEPVAEGFRDAFGDIYEFYGTPREGEALRRVAARLEMIRKSHSNDRCGIGIWTGARNYFFGKAATQLDALAAENRKKGRAVSYINTGVLFPVASDERHNFFIDEVHVNDAGRERLASTYAGVILAQDFPHEFPQVEWRGPNADINVFQAKSHDIPWIEPGTLVATYGKNCAGFHPPVGTNNVYEGNATDYVLRICAKSSGFCEIPIDVTQIGDPANSCGKDFQIEWECHGLKETNHASVPGEADHRRIRISCQS
jgi:hypothetical protein